MYQILNYYWRLVATALSFTLFGIGGVIMPLVATPFIRLVARTPEQQQRYARVLIYRTFRLFIYTMRAMGVLTWSTSNLNALKRQSLLVLANHPTLLDVVFLVAHIPHADCIVKGKLTTNPAMKGFLKMTGFIANDHGPELVDRAAQSINKGSALIIFPEGTRTRPGGNLNFQRGAANIALAANAKVVPVVIRCEPITLSKCHRWYHIPKRAMHFSLTACDDYAMDTYLSIPRTLASRRLTQDLQHYFENELQS